MKKRLPPWAKNRQTRQINASYGRHFKRLGASYFGTLSNWVSTIISDRLSEREKRRIADRAWDLYLNGSVVRGVVESLLTEVVGTGLTPQPNPMIRWLGLGPEWQLQFQQKAFDLFEIWGLDSRNLCDASRRLNIYMLQTLALFCWKLEGIGVFQVIYEKDKKAPLKFSLLPVDPSRLQTPVDKTKEDIYDGVELDKNGAPKAVWILKPSKYGLTKPLAKSDDMTRIEVVSKDTGLNNILLVADVRNIAEYRQDSIVASMMKEIRDGEDAVDATIVKFLVSNLFALFVTDEGETFTNPETLKNTEWQDRIREIDKGTILMGSPGEKPEVIKSGDQPGPDYDRMWQSIISRIGMVTGRGPEHTLKQYNNSYSASRASIENAVRFDEKDRQVLENCFCGPSWTWLVYESAIKGLLPVKSITHFLGNLYAYCRCDWLSPEERPIDQLKAKNAEKVGLETNTETYSGIFAKKARIGEPG